MRSLGLLGLIACLALTSSCALRLPVARGAGGGTTTLAGGGTSAASPKARILKGQVYVSRDFRSSWAATRSAARAVSGARLDQFPALQDVEVSVFAVGRGPFDPSGLLVGGRSDGGGRYELIVDAAPGIDLRVRFRREGYADTEVLMSRTAGTDGELTCVLVPMAPPGEGNAAPMIAPLPVPPLPGPDSDPLPLPLPDSDSPTAPESEPLSASGREVAHDPSSASWSAAAVIPVAVAGYTGGGKDAPSYRDAFAAGYGLGLVALSRARGGWRLAASLETEALRGQPLEIAGAGTVEFSDWLMVPIGVGLRYEPMWSGDTAGREFRRREIRFSPYLEGLAGGAWMDELSVRLPDDTRTAYTASGFVPSGQLGAGLTLRWSGGRAWVGVSWRYLAAPGAAAGASATFAAEPGGLSVLPWTFGLEVGF